jgi:hypothetical protein
MNTHKRTFRVQYGIELKGRKETTLYSKVGPLVITKSVDRGRAGYVVTHAVSGLAVARADRLFSAREAHKRLLPLTDWSRPASALEYDKVLLDRVREVVVGIEAHILVRVST